MTLYKLSVVLVVSVNECNVLEISPPALIGEFFCPTELNYLQGRKLS